MSIRKTDTFCCQTVYMRSLNILGAITLQITISQIVRIDHNHIRKIMVSRRLSVFGSFGSIYPIT